MTRDLLRWLGERLAPVPPGIDRLDRDFVVPAEVRPRTGGNAASGLSSNAAIHAAGIDVEACTNASLHLGTMTELGYAFQLGRRRKALTSGVGPLADRLSETGAQGPDLRPGWIPPAIEKTRCPTDGDG